MMSLSRQGAADVRLHEGFVDHYYLDSATPPVGTIGIGFTWGSTAFRKWWGTVKMGKKFGPGATMTRSEAEEVLQFIVAEEYGQAVNEFLGGDVPQHVYDGMVSVVFNCGPGALKWKWAEAIKEGDYEEAAKRLETTAVTAGGKKLKGLVTRRKEEASLIRDGIYVSGGTAGPAMPKDDDKSDDDGILRIGERGKAVMNMQAQLSQLGLYSGVIDGIFGRGTELAVRQFQAGHKLDVDGIAGTKTLKALG